MVGIGVLVGAVVAARYGERWGVARDESYTLATKLVFAGVIGARLTWAVTHSDRDRHPARRHRGVAGRLCSSPAGSSPP